MTLTEFEDKAYQPIMDCIKENPTDQFVILVSDFLHDYKILRSKVQLKLNQVEDTQFVQKIYENESGFKALITYMISINSFIVTQMELNKISDTPRDHEEIIAVLTKNYAALQEIIDASLMEMGTYSGYSFHQAIANKVFSSM
jgi:hypothetical protein